MCVCVRANLLRVLTLCDPMDYSQAGSSVHGFSRHEYWRALPCPPPEDLLDPGIEPTSTYGLLHWQAGSLPLAPPGKPRICVLTTHGRFG